MYRGYKMVRLQLRFLWLKPYYTNVWLALKFLPPANEVWGKVMFLPAATKLGQGNVFTGVCDSVNREGGLPQCMLGYHPTWEQTPPPGSRHTHTPRTRLPPLGADTPPPGPDPPGSRHPPGADPPCQQAAGTHPTGMHSCYTCQSVMVFTRGRGCYDVTSCYGQYPPPGQHLQIALMPPPESEQPPPPPVCFPFSNSFYFQWKL